MGVEPATMSLAAPLSVRERADLDQLEAVVGRGLSTFHAVARAREIIKRGRQTFEEVTRALLEIHRRQLFRPMTFAQYLKRRFKMCRSRAYQLLAAAKLIERCAAKGTQPPRNESQARRMIYGAPMPIAAAPADEPEEEDEEIDLDAADRASRQRPGLAMTARVEKLLAELRKINARHPWRTRADELLNLYRDTVLPWPAAS